MALFVQEGDARTLPKAVHLVWTIIVVIAAADIILHGSGFTKQSCFNQFTNDMP